MITHILKDGTKVKDITGHVVSDEKVRDLTERVRERKKK